MNKSFSNRNSIVPGVEIFQITIALLLIILIVMLIAGCGTTEKAVSQTDTVHYTVPPEKEKAPETLSPAASQAEPVIDTFDIGLILPFFLDSVTEIPDTVEVSYDQQSKLAIEFYNGVMRAIDDLSEKGLPARVHVYDDSNDKVRTISLTKVADLKKMDLMIGPVYNNNLRIMAEFAKYDSVMLVSPLSPAVNITSYNPYYVMVNPTIEVHCKKIFDYIVAHHHNDNILLLTRPESKEAEYATIFRNYLNQYQNETRDYSLQFTQVTFAPNYGTENDNSDSEADENLEAFFKDSVKNIVIVPSLEKAYIHSVGRNLYPLAEPPAEDRDAIKYDITVFGLPAWGDLEDLRFEYVQKLNVHYTSSYFVNPEFYSKDNEFYRQYLEDFQNEPSEYVIKGYDLMTFFGNMLLQYGAGFDTLLCTKKAQGIHTTFQFGVHYAATAPTVSTDSLIAAPRVDFIENKYVHLLKYEDYHLIKVDD